MSSVANVRAWRVSLFYTLSTVAQRSTSVGTLRTWGRSSKSAHIYLFREELSTRGLSKNRRAQWSDYKFTLEHEATWDDLKSWKKETIPAEHNLILAAWRKSLACKDAHTVEEFTRRIRIADEDFPIKMDDRLAVGFARAIIVKS